jgi:alanyl-tRNA synthetase
VTGERRHVVALSGDYDEDYIRLLSAELRKHPGTISLLGTTDGCIVCSAADDVDIDLAVLVAEQARSCGGSGGGKGRFANARLPETVDPAAFLEDVAARVCAA